MRDRTRASFALVVGAIVVLAGAAGRLVGSGEWPPELVITAIALMIVALLATIVARPRPRQLLSLGAAPLAAPLGVVMAGWALYQPKLGPLLWPSAVAALGGLTAVAAFARWSLAAGAHLGPRAPLDPAHRYGVARAGAKLKMMAARDLVAGDRVEVPAGQRIPTDGTIAEGDGFADERALTGAELAVSKEPGDPVLAGTTADVPLVYVAASAPAESLTLRLHRHTHALLGAIAHEGHAAGGAVLAIVMAMGAVITGALVLHTTPLLARGLSLATGVLLALNASASFIAARRALAFATTRAIRRGIVPARPADLRALARVARWQADVAVLAPTSKLEVMGEPEELLPIVAALLDDTTGAEARAVAAALRRKHLRPAAAAALRRGAGTWHGTVAGERWCLGPIRAVTEEARVEVPRELSAGLAFLEERSAATWLLARTGDSIAGAIGVVLEIDADAARVATALKATVMPGPPDGVRAAIATAAHLDRDGPPLRSRDGSLVAPHSPAPSTGLVVEVREPSAAITFAAPVTVFAPSAPGLLAVIDDARALQRRAVRAMALGMAVPIVLIVPLLALGVLDPVLGTVAGLLGAVIAARASGPLATPDPTIRRV